MFTTIKTSFERIINRNKYRSAITNQAKSNNLDYFIDQTFQKVNILFALTFQKVNRLFVLSFESEKGRIFKYLYLIYYEPKVEIKYYNALIDGKSFLRYLEETNFGNQ